MAFAPLPGIQLSWTAPTLAGGDTFEQFNIYRQLHTGGTWQRIALVLSSGATSYTDYTPASGVSYDYATTITVLRSGVPIESDFASATVVTRSVTYTSLFLHDTSDPTQYLEWQGNAQKVDAYQAQAMSTGWNSKAPTLYVGEAESAHYQLTSIRNVPIRNLTLWNTLRALFTRQRTNGSVYQYRNALTGDVDFVGISGEQRRAGASGSGGALPIQRTDNLSGNVDTVDLIAISYTGVV